MQHAAAAEVFFDPDSPAGKEYALPLDQARDEATGGSGPDRLVGEKAPLFGEGVTPRDDDGDDGVETRADQDPASGSQAGDRGSPGGAAAAVRLSKAGAGDGYPLTSGLMLVAAVVLLGAGLGLALRLSGRALSKPA